MAKVFDDLATRFVSFSDALEAQFGDLSIDFSLPSKTLKGAKAVGTGNAAGDARALSAAAAEREAAKNRGEEILQQLPPGYFDSSFDALKHELCQMGADAKQDDIDVVVDRLTAAMEVVGMRLARHVLKNQDKLIAGITSVTHVEDDIRAAYVVCRGSRAQLRTASEEVQRQIKIITSTRMKQHSMELLDVLSRVKKVKDLPAALRHAHEEGDHAEAILLCVDCFHAVETLSMCKVAPALQVAVQRAYYDAMQQLNTALLNVCTDFKGPSYSRLLEAYLLQGVPPEALADKVLSCFSELFQDVSTRLVRSMVLARAYGQQSENVGSPRSSTGGLQLDECDFASLCRHVQPDMLSTCLLKLLEASYDLLASYHNMLSWHEASLAEHTQAAAAAAAAAASAAARSPGQSQDGAVGDDGAAAPADATPSQEQLDQVQAATKGILAAVQGTLQTNKMATAEAAAAQVKDLLVGAGGCTGSDFPQVVAACLRFCSVAEAFAGNRLAARDALMHIMGAFVKGSHKSNMQALKHCLAVETWGAGSSQGSTAEGSSSSSTACSDMDVTCLQQALGNNAYLVCSYGGDGFISDYAEWLESGNPFRKQGRAVGGRSVLNKAGNKVPGPASSSTADNITSSSSSNSPAGQTSCGTSKSSVQVLQWMRDYAGLMVPMPSQQQQLWAGIAELFDNYLLACFVLFSGVTLQSLVWQDDCLPNRLRSALLRITTQSNCKYKAEVEELQRTKPPPPTNDAASTAGGSSSTSTLDMFTKKFKHTMVELINADLSQPMTDGHGPVSMQPTARQQRRQQQQQQTSATTPRQAMPQQQQQQAQEQQNPGANGSIKPEGTAQVTSSQDTKGGHDAQQQQQPGPHATFFKQCVSAIKSLALLADALKTAKAALLQSLKGAGLTKEVDGYFSRTVDAAADLREAIYLGAAKRLLPGLADDEYGLSSAIAECNYNMPEPATRYQPWVGEVLQQYTAFGGALTATKLPLDIQHKFWDAALQLGAEAILNGMGQVRRCSQQGRAAMSLDLSAVEKGLRQLAPPSALSSLGQVDKYIKAFYIPWEELSRWAQTHLAEYSKARILVLVEAMADAYGVKRGQRTALLDSIRVQLAEFA